MSPLYHFGFTGEKPLASRFRSPRIRQCFTSCVRRIALTLRIPGERRFGGRVSATLIYVCDTFPNSSYLDLGPRVLPAAKRIEGIGSRRHDR